MKGERCKGRLINQGRNKYIMEKKGARCRPERKPKVRITQIKIKKCRDREIVCII